MPDATPVTEVKPTDAPVKTDAAPIDAKPVDVVAVVADAKPADIAPIAPEKYEFTRSDDSRLSDAHVEAIEALAKDLKLPQDQATKLLGVQESAMALYEDTAIEQFQARLKAGDQELKDDPEFGGAKYAATISANSEVLKRYDIGGKLGEKLKASGYDQDPDLRRMFARIAKATQEDQGIHGKSQTTSSNKSRAERMYGTDS